MKRFITSDDAVALKKLPRSLIIWVRGDCDCAFAQFFTRFGVKVTSSSAPARIERSLTRMPAWKLKKVFRREGVQFLPHQTPGREA